MMADLKDWHNSLKGNRIRTGHSEQLEGEQCIVLDSGAQPNGDVEVSQIHPLLRYSSGRD
jgi:hypothetical protein